MNKSERSAPPPKIIPIEVKELFKLTDHAGIQPTDISFPTVSMDSDDLICVRANVPGMQQPGTKKMIVVISTTENKVLVKTNAHTDAAIINVNKKWLGLKMGPAMQIFDLNKGANINTVNLASKNEIPLSWRWIDPKTVAIVTNMAVHHWHIDDSNETGDLEEQFARNNEAPFDKAAVINYQTNSKRDAHIVICYARAEDSNDVKGWGQLYHNGKQTKVEAHAAAFCDFKPVDGLDENTNSQLLLLTSHRTRDLDAKLVIQSLTAKRPTQRSCPYKLQQPDDFPVLIETIDRIGVVYVISKFGGLYLFDIESGTLIYKQRLTTDSIFTGTRYRADPSRKMLEGVICITKGGQVISVQTDFKLLMSSLMRSNQQTVALRIAFRMNLPNTEDLYWNHFDNLKTKKLLKEAIELVAMSPKGMLRTERAMNGLAQFGDNAVQEYLQYLENRGMDFNDAESKHY